jgi:hypothetical protein
VVDLWRAWSVGAYGCPAWKDLEAEWGPRWRVQHKANAQYFSSRKRIIHEVQQRAEAAGQAAEVVASQLDAELAQFSPPKSLDWLFKDLKRKAKAAQRDLG